MTTIQVTFAGASELHELLGTSRREAEYLERAVWLAFGLPPAAFIPAAGDVIDGVWWERAPDAKQLSGPKAETPEESSDGITH